MKPLVSCVLVFGLLYLLGYQMHYYYLSHIGFTTSFSLHKVYVFHALFSFLICVFFLFLSKRERFKDQLGFLYLGTFVFKLMTFAVIFSRVLFSTLKFTFEDKLSLLFPLVIFLSLEAYFITKILAKINTSNK